MADADRIRSSSSSPRRETIGGYMAARAEVTGSSTLDSE
jgi:hypothetical protein